MSLWSPRDPRSAETLQSFSKAMDWAKAGRFTEQDIDEAKLSVFSAVDAPVAPSDRGMCSKPCSAPDMRCRHGSPRPSAPVVRRRPPRAAASQCGPLAEGGILSSQSLSHPRPPDLASTPRGEAWWACGGQQSDLRWKYVPRVPLEQGPCPGLLPRVNCAHGQGWTTSCAASRTR